MKNRTILSILLAALLLVGMLSGCSKSAPMENYFSSAESAGSGVFDSYDAAEKVETSSTAGSDQAEAPLSDRKLIKTVELTAETEELDALLEAITQRVNELGGYVENQRIYNGSNYASHRSRSASMTIRIPAEELDGFVEHVGTASNIVSRYAYIDDVTLTYVATESRVAALQAEHDRLLELMAKAETMADLLEVEARLTDVRYELERVTSQLNVLKNQVSYSTVRLNVDEVVEYTPVEEETFWQRISGGFVDSIESIGEGFVEFAVFFIVGLPYFVLLGGITAVIVVLAKRSVRKKKARKAEKNQENQA